MPASIATFRAFLPAFTEALVPDVTLQLYLDMAETQMATGLGDNADAGQSFLTAHLLSMAGIGPGNQAGSLAGFTSLKVGSLALTRSDKVSMGEYFSSQWGQLYWLLWRRYAGPAIFVTPTGVLPYNNCGFTHGQGD